MRLILIYGLIFLSINAFAQDYYDLNWKLENNEKIAYLTVMEQIDSAKVELPSIIKNFQELLAIALIQKKLMLINSLNPFIKELRIIR
jgi:hypothetical protein